MIKVSCFSSISPIGPLVYRENRKAGYIIGTICFSSVSLNGKHILQKTNIQYSFYYIGVLWSVIVIRSISRSLSHFFNLKVIKSGILGLHGTHFFLRILRQIVNSSLTQPLRQIQSKYFAFLTLKYRNFKVTENN